MNFILSHKIIVVVVALLVAVGVWIGISSSSSSGGSLLSSEVVAGDGPDKDLVATLLALRTVKLDASLFTDPAFLSLKDFSVEIVPEPVGRPNPFAPLTGAAAAAAATPGSDAASFAPKAGSASKPTLPKYK